MNTSKLCGDNDQDWHLVLPRKFLEHELWLRLTPAQRSVFQTLYLHADKKRSCYPSMSTISRLAGVALRTAQVCIRWLESEWYISITPHFHNGQQRSNLYHLLVWPLEVRDWGKTEGIPEEGVQNIHPDVCVGAENAPPPRKDCIPRDAENAYRTVSIGLYPGKGSTQTPLPSEDEKPSAPRRKYSREQWAIMRELAEKGYSTDAIRAFVGPPKEVAVD